MAKNKTGLSYYSIDTDRYQDIKIKRLKKEHCCEGLAVYDYILCEIYRVRGCYIEWDESTAFDVADYLGLKETKVKEIVSYCCYVGLFDKALLASERVLTSLSIQSRYKDFCIRAKRNKIDIPEKYLIPTEESDIIPEESSKTPEDCREVKRSKVKKSKENDIDESSGKSIAVPREVHGYVPSPSMSLDEIFRIITAPESIEKPWLIAIANNHHIDGPKVGTYLIDFFKHLKAEGVSTKSLKDFKSHFNNWLRMQLSSYKKPNLESIDTMREELKREIRNG